MPLSRLLATSTAVYGASAYCGACLPFWIFGAAQSPAGSLVAIVSDNPLATGGASRHTNALHGPTGALRDAAWQFQNLPTSARGAAIDFVQFESTARRSGGNVGGQYRVHAADATTRFIYASIQPGAPPGAGLNRTFTTAALTPTGGRWRQSDIDTDIYGIRGGPNFGTGISVYFLAMRVTWRGRAGSQVVKAISWLGPLLAAGFNGLNLFHENNEVLARLNLLMQDTLHTGGIGTVPTLTIPEEKEMMLKSLFVRPSYVFL